MAAVLGTIGLTGSTVSARVKSSALSLGGALRDAVHKDLMVCAVTVLPEAPFFEGAALRRAMILSPGSRAEPAPLNASMTQSSELDRFVRPASETRNSEHGDSDRSTP